MSTNYEALKSDIRAAIINNKVNACPMAVRLAWHASGTYDKDSQTGGSNGATMRFPVEANDGANAGLSILRDMLHPVKAKNEAVSTADVWIAAGSAAIEFTGGPQIPFAFGRTDGAEGCYVPPNGRLPDASQGAQHLRDVFYRMGFNDQEIVALSGAHTLGSCHMTRSGFDGPWTKTPLKFNNEYFKNILELEWQPRVWDGPLQYEDVATKSLMMLPTDLCLKTDPGFAPHVARYAADAHVFAEEFASAYAKLLSNNCPAPCTNFTKAERSNDDLFRDYSMHGSIEKVQKYKDAGANVHSTDPASQRAAVHYAAFWGHAHVIKYLIESCGCNVNVQDSEGDSPLHDAARFAHAEVVTALLAAGADKAMRNKAGMTALQVAQEYGKTSTAGRHAAVIALLQ